MQNPTNRGRIITMVTAIVRGVLGGAIVVLVTLAYCYFHPLLALWLVILAVLTFIRPVLGVAVLFVVISIDTAKPIIGGIFVDYSEIEFATVLCAWMLTVKDLRDLNWKPLLWGTPFLVAVAISGFVNIPWYKVPFHVARLSELVAAVFLACNCYRVIDQSSTLGLDRELVNSTDAGDSRTVFRWAILAAAIFYPLAGFSQLDETLRIYSFFTNPNQFAGYLTLLLPTCLVLFLSGSGRLHRWVWFYVFLWVSVALIATLSRTGIVGAVVATSLVLVLHYSRHGRLDETGGATKGIGLSRIALLPLTAVVLAYLLIGTSLPEMIKTQAGNLQFRSQGGFAAQLVQGRLPYFAVGWEVWRDHVLFGVGPGRYKRVLKDYGHIISQFEGRVKYYEVYLRNLPIHAHNLYLQLAADFGLLGLVAFGYLVVFYALSLWRNQTSSYWARAGTGLLVAFLIHNLLDVTFPSLALEMGLLLGICLPSATRWSRLKQ